MTFGFGNQHSIQLSYGRTQLGFYAQRIGASMARPTTRDATAASNFVVHCTPRYNARLVLRQRAPDFQPMPPRSTILIQLSGTAR